MLLETISIIRKKKFFSTISLPSRTRSKDFPRKSHAKRIEATHGEKKPLQNDITSEVTYFLFLLRLLTAL